MINTQNREDCKAFFDKLDLKKQLIYVNAKMTIHPQKKNQIKYQVEYQMMNYKIYYSYIFYNNGK